LKNVGLRIRFQKRQQDDLIPPCVPQRYVAIAIVGRLLDNTFSIRELLALPCQQMRAVEGVVETGVKSWRCFSVPPFTSIALSFLAQAASA
jgi:hypothetical protein